MEILDPDLWNDDGTPKRPSQAYMDSLAAIQTHGEGLARIVDNTKPMEISDKAIVDGAYLNYSRLKRQAKEARPPEVGDIVHWWDVWEGDGEERPPICRAAIVMEIESFGHGACLRVHVPRERYRDQQADHDELRAGTDTWHWPCGEGQ